jgi:hypothetical protein
VNINQFLRKSGIFRSGAVAGTYKNAKERPTELMMDGVYNADTDLINSKQSNQTEPEQPQQKANLPTEPNKSKKTMPKWLKITLISVGVLFGLFILLGIFGTPSAERVFNDSLDEMLQVQAVTIQQDIKGSEPQEGLDEISLNSQGYIDMRDETKLTAKGDFTIGTKGQFAVTAKADYLALDNSTFIKFTDLTSSNAEISQGFAVVSQGVKGKWIITRDSDSLTQIAEPAISALTNITALPFANLNDEKRQELLKILQDSDAFTIKESAKVEVNGASAYRYELEYNQEKQQEV